MVSISQETAQETEARLRRVIRESRLVIYGDAYAFEEFPISQFNLRANPGALALVRDDAIFSQLVPATNDAEEPFILWRFHFPRGADNSGFVGWLASLLKAKLGTGVFVVCGQNSNDGGIFDYWGAPWVLAPIVKQALEALLAGEAP
jgi:Family of unknown function (DUF6196)